MSGFPSRHQKKVILVLLTTCIISLGSLAHSAWATPAQDPHRQTVPTSTPSSYPVVVILTPTAGTITATLTATVTAAPAPTLVGTSTPTRTPVPLPSPIVMTSTPTRPAQAPGPTYPFLSGPVVAVIVVAGVLALLGALALVLRRWQ